MKLLLIFLVFIQITNAQIDNLELLLKTTNQYQIQDKWLLSVRNSEAFLNGEKLNTIFYKNNSKRIHDLIVIKNFDQRQNCQLGTFDFVAKINEHIYISRGCIESTSYQRIITTFQYFYQSRNIAQASYENNP